MGLLTYVSYVYLSNMYMYKSNMYSRLARLRGRVAQRYYVLDGSPIHGPLRGSCTYSSYVSSFSVVWFSAFT